MLRKPRTHRTRKGLSERGFPAKLEGEEGEDRFAFEVAGEADATTRYQSRVVGYAIYRKTVSLKTADPDRRFIDPTSNGTGTGLSLSKFFSARIEGTGTHNTPRRLLVNLPNIGSLHLELSTGRHTGFQGDAPPNPPTGF